MMLLDCVLNRENNKIALGPSGLYLIFSQLGHWASDRQELAAEWINVQARPIVISDSTQNSYQPNGLVLLESYQPKANFTHLAGGGGTKYSPD